MNPFIIAEIGVNHDGDFNKAIKLVEIAKIAGASAVKFQSFTAERISAISTPKVEYQEERDIKRTHFNMLRDLELTFNEQEAIFNHCYEIGIEFFSTPYSIIDAKFLNDLGVKRFKTASADIVDLPLHKAISDFGKETLISTGMATKAEIQSVVNIYKNAKCNIVLMHTTSEYPTNINNCNLLKLELLRMMSPMALGYSDHTTSSTCAIMATALSCTYFEKHFTLNKSDPGPDHAASLNPVEFKNYVEDLNLAFSALGKQDAIRTDKEQNMADTSRKSLHYARNLRIGESITLDDLKLVRPGTGILYSGADEIVGQKLSINVNINEIVKKDQFN